MAVSRNAKEVKLVIRVDEGNDKVKSLTYNRIKVDANDEAILAAGKAIGSLQPKPVSGIWRHDVVALNG